jgi:hypothetical protein
MTCLTPINYWWGISNLRMSAVNRSLRLMTFVVLGVLMTGTMKGLGRRNDDKLVSK